MPEISCPGPAGEYASLKAAPGGGIEVSHVSAAGKPVFTWSMSHSQALTFAARVLGTLGYREVHLRDDCTVASAT